MHPDPDSEEAALERRVAELEQALKASEESLAIERLKLQQTEAALLQMAALFGNAPVSLILMGDDGRITDLNAEAERAFRCRREAVLGRPLEDVIDPVDREEARRLIAECLEGAVQRGVERLLWPGRACGLEDSTLMFPIRNAAGEVVGAAMTEDLTEIKDSRSLLATVNRELRQLAVLDGLTGLVNRRSYERVLSREVRRAARSREPMTVAMIDVDEFKAFNDTLGHAAGDAVLRAVADVLRGAAQRAGDVVARYGGEEFVAVLPGVDAEGAARIGERMRSEVEQLAVPRDDDDSAVVTISVGLATWVPYRDSAPPKIVEAADRALYQAKDEGRNRVVVVDLGRDGPARSLGADAGSSKHEAS